MQIRWAMKFLARVNVETSCSDIFLFDLFCGWKLWLSRCVRAYEYVWVACMFKWVFVTHCLCMHARITKIVCCLESLTMLEKKCQIVWGMWKLWCARKFSAIIQLNGSAWQSALKCICVWFVKFTLILFITWQTINVEWTSNSIASRTQSPAYIHTDTHSTSHRISHRPNVTHTLNRDSWWWFISYRWLVCKFLLDNF